MLWIWHPRLFIFIIFFFFLLLFIVHSTAKVISALIHIHIIAHDDSGIHRRCYSREIERRHRVLRPYSCPISSNLSRRHRHRCTPEADRGVTSFLMTLVMGPPAGRTGLRWDSNVWPLVPKSNALSTRPPRPPISYSDTQRSKSCILLHYKQYRCEADRDKVPNEMRPSF